MAIDVIDHTIPAPAHAQAHRDIDQDDADDPQQCTEYIGEIYSYLRELEVGPALFSDADSSC